MFPWSWKSPQTCSRNDSASPSATMRPQHWDRRRELCKASMSSAPPCQWWNWEMNFPRWRRAEQRLICWKTSRRYHSIGSPVKAFVMDTVMVSACNSQAAACDIMSHMSSCAALGNIVI
jgi:hypothetical protein